jgi:hypothetical protein
MIETVSASSWRAAGTASRLTPPTITGKTKTKLSAQDRVILFYVATGIDHGLVHITDMGCSPWPSGAFIAHNRESGAYTLTDSEPLRRLNRNA